jgi:zinc transport system substrate-binding protein
MSSKDMKTLEEAEVFIINGADMESFMDDVTSQMKQLKIVNASEGIELIEGDSEEGPNPHVWVSISNAITQVQTIEKQLSLVDPARSTAYKKNADDYTKRLEVQKEKMHKLLDNINQRNIVTFHEAFPYFAKEFNLTIKGVIEREPGSQPSAKELAGTIDQIKTLGIKALFAEPQYPEEAAKTIASETGAKLYILDPAVAGPMEANAYIDIMDKNLEVLEEALK